MNRKQRLEIESVVESLGFRPVSITPTTNHILVVFHDGKNTVKYHTSSTPSDWRELMNMKRAMKRAAYELTIKRERGCPTS